MSGLSSHGETIVLAAITTTAYVSLHIADPGDTGANEVVGPNYVREGPIAFTNAGSDPTVASNSAIVSFATAAQNWGNVTFFGLWDAATGGHFQGSNAVTPPKYVGAGDLVRFLAGQLTVSAL
jgi:hypothetical protein